ncbi:MAG TPA: DNA polymerase [Terriglobales bacterium]|nr:DNA polymerase [Terriglobales bacterium]
MSTLRPYGFNRVITIDTEFRLDEDYRQHVVCLVAHDWPSGCISRLWLDDNQNQAFQLPCDEDTLWVSFVAVAELRSMLGLHHPLPKRVLDLYAENRWLCNIQESPSERARKKDENSFSLVATLRRFGCDSMAAEEKEEMIELILRGGPYAAQQELDILDYCEADVNGLDALLPKMLPKIDIRRAIARGGYIIEMAKIEDRGVPIDAPRLETIRARADDLIRDLIGQQPHIDVYDGTTFNQKKFEAFLARNGLANRWRRTTTGMYTADDGYLEEMGEYFPIIEELRQLKKVVLQLQRHRFQAGADGRARCPLWPFSSITGRNQPSAGKEQKNGLRSQSPYVFGLPKALRFLIRPTPGMALAYIDWEQQEFMIAALMSGDKEMQKAYRSGNPYLALAKKLGAVPQNAAKNTHPAEHEKFKAVVLGVNYSRTKYSLSKVLGLPINECANLIQGYWKSFSTYADWRRTVRVLMLGFGRLWVWDGWQCLLGVQPNIRAVLNWPVQSTGAVLLRLAIILAARRGVRIIATVHDAIMIEARDEDIEEHMRLAKEAMDEACRTVLGDVIRTECQVIRASGRYYDAKGEKLWKIICNFMGWEQPQSNEPEKVGHAVSS